MIIAFGVFEKMALLQDVFMRLWVLELVSRYSTHLLVT